MGYKVDNAVIMAAGTASRFAPLSFEVPKCMIEVRGEILIERQIRQLLEAGVPQIYIVVGYKKEQFAYLTEKYGVILVENPDYLTRNNNASIYAVRGVLGNTYICSSDNYFAENPFEAEVDGAYYAGVYADGETAEWCMEEDADGYVRSVTVGGAHAWYMLGHAFWTREYSEKFLQFLKAVYDRPETKDLYWENIYMQHLDALKMKIRKYAPDVIYEFDTLDELRQFDESYIGDTRSQILKAAARQLACTEAEMTALTAYKDKDNAAAGFRFLCRGQRYEYEYKTESLRRIEI